MPGDEGWINHPAGSDVFCDAVDGECACWLSAKIHRVQSDHECITCGKVWPMEDADG